MRTRLYILTFSFSLVFVNLFAQQPVNLKTIKAEDLRTIDLGTHVVENGILVPSPQTSIAQNDTLFDNTQSQNVFLSLTDDLGLSLPQEVIDWGTTVGGTVTSLTFSYVTSLTQNIPPGQSGNGEGAARTKVDFHLYWGTDQNDDGMKIFSVSHTGGFSPDGKPTRFNIDVELSNTLRIDPGRFGWALEVLSPSNKTGPLLATGGKGATRIFRVKPGFENSNLFFRDLSLSGSFYLQLRGDINPTADNSEDDTYDTNGNMGIRVSANEGLLANDTSADSVETADGSSAEGGEVTVKGDGSFVYQPPPGFEGMDSFTYIMQDDQGMLNCATVKINVTAPVWFISNDDPGFNEGTFNNPFVALVDFNAAQDDAANPRGPKDGQIIYLFESQQVYNQNGIILKPRQVLAGQGISLVNLLQGLGFTVHDYSYIFPNPPEAGTPPMIANSTGNAIQLADDNIVRGLNIGNSLLYGIFGSGSGSLDIKDVNISGMGGAMNLMGYTLDANFGSITSTDAPEDGIRLNQTFGSMIIQGPVIMNNTTDAGINIEDSDVEFSIGGSYSYTGKIGVSLKNNSGSFMFQDVDITTTGGDGVKADSVNSLSITDGSINTQAGIGFDARAVDLSATFESITSDGGLNGIRLRLTTGSFQVNGGTISNTIEDGIRSKNAEGVRLRNININDSGRHSIFRTGFIFELDAQNITINGSGSEGVMGQLNLKSEYGNSTETSGLQKVSEVRQTTNNFILKESNISNTGGDGVKIQVGGTDSANVTITGNTITTSSDFGLTMQTSDSGFALVELANNTSSGATSDFNLIQDSTSTFALKEFTGGDSAAVVSFIQNNNTGTPTVAVAGTIRAESTTSVSRPGESVVPTEFALEQNYPNPFNPSTTIQFALPKQSKVTLKLFDLLGREISTLINEDLQAGKYEFTFEANDLPTGIYFYQLRTEGFFETKKLTLLK